MSSNIRLQGTDGVRGVVVPSDHESVRRLSPQEAFLEKGVITEQFVELYGYCVVRVMMEWEVMEPGHEVVVGWDPRDGKGLFARAAVRGILKAGAKALIAGVLPTPAIPLYMLYRRAHLGLAVTGSHNPADQNGIKIFLPHYAMKPLLTEDRAISAATLETDYGSLATLKEKLRAEDVSAHAVGLFTDFCCQSRNSWIERPDALSDLTLIVDPANGAYTGVAEEIFRRLGASEIIQVNSSKDGPVNRGSGVTQFEGNRYIDAKLVGSGGRDFSTNATAVALFQTGRRKRRQILAGNALVSAAVFDADGDRFYRIDYHAAEDMASVLTGDEIAILQAEHLVQHHPEICEDGLFITTVESDINALSHVKGLGLETKLTGVGDKWILRQIAECHLPRGVSRGSYDHLSALSYLGLLKSTPPDRRKGRSAFCMGSEESGHNITTGWLEDVRGETLPVYVGNGMKSAANSFAATASLRSRLSQREYWRHVREPFSPGFKKTYYVYHSERDKFRRGSPSWNGLESLLRSQITRLLGGRCRVNRLKFTEDEDMLYLSVRRDDDMQAGLFARNSGTEDKSSINVRGREEDGQALSDVGSCGIAYLASEIKSGGSPMGEASLKILEMLCGRGPLPEGKLRQEFKDIDIDRLLDEMLNKEKSLYKSGDQLHLSPLGNEMCKRRFG